MHRLAEAELTAWKTRRGRKPLVLRGARQVGKTHLVQAFGKAHFANVVTLNLERQPKLADLFEDPDPQVSVRHLEMALRVSITPGKTLLFLDEIQAAPQVFAKLRYFAEELGQLHVVAAGSLLEFVLAEHEFSMPVGRLSFLHLEPMTFEEFLLASGEVELVELLHELTPKKPIPATIHEKLMQLVRTYTVVGGMPAAVAAWQETQSLAEVQRLQGDLIATFRDDFAKYRKRINRDRLQKVFDALPRFVGRKFVAAHVDREQRTAPIKDAFAMLCLARLATPVTRSACNGIPLGTELSENYVKVCFLDVGAFVHLSGLDASQLVRAQDLTLVHAGQVAEQFVGQELRAMRPFEKEPVLYCWAREERTSNAEVDYVIQNRQSLIPIEVKAGASGWLKSMHVFLDDKRRSIGVRVCSEPMSVSKVKTAVPGRVAREFELWSVPFYLTGQLARLLPR